MRPYKASFTALSTILLTFPASAQQPRFTVLMNVPIENQFADQVRSVVSRELRGLRDVTLVDRQGQFFISIVPKPLQLKDGQTVGVLLSYVFQDGDWIFHDVITGTPVDLKSLCERIVATFDVKVLEPKRRPKR